MNKIFQNIQIRYALLGTVAALVFGVITNILPPHLSQKDPLYGYGSDSEIYWDLSTNIKEGRGFVHSPGFDFAYLYKTDQYTYGTQRTPGYPLVLAGVRTIFQTDSPNSIGITVFNLMLVFLNCYFIVGILKKQLPQVPSKFYSFIAIFPLFLIYGNGINVDFITGVLLAAFCYFLQNNKLAFVSIFLGGFALFTRGNVLFFLAPFWIFYLVFFKDQKQKIVIGSLGLILLAIIFLGWSYRNFQLSGSFTFAPFTGFQLRQNYITKIYENNKPEGEEQFYRWDSPAYLRQEFMNALSDSGNNLYVAEAKIDKQLTKDTFVMLIQKPFVAAKVYVRGILQMFVNEYFIFNLGRQINSQALWLIIWVVVLLGFLLPALVFCFFGLVLLRKLNKTFLSAVTYSGILYLLLTCTVWGGFARYQLPVYFAILISFVVCFYRLINLDFAKLNWYNTLRSMLKF